MDDRGIANANGSFVLVAQGVQLAGEYEGHPSVRRLVHDRYQVITF